MKSSDDITSEQSILSVEDKHMLWIVDPESELIVFWISSCNFTSLNLLTYFKKWKLFSNYFKLICYFKQFLNLKEIF